MIALSQTKVDSTISLNLLRAPSSPAFNILGISPTSIDKPTDLNAFKVSLQNATGNFSKLPSDYSLELAPANIFGKRGLTLGTYDSTKFKYVFWQSLSFSTAITHANIDDKATNDSNSFTKLGIGIKFSILRGRWTNKTREKYETISKALATTNEDVMNAFNNNKIINAWRKEKDSILHSANLNSFLIDKLNKNIDSLKDNLSAEVSINNYQKIHDAINNFKIDRVGPFLDFTSGIALDFPDNRFNYSLVSKVGAWITGGYENSEKGISFLGIGRYLYQPDKIFADDAGKLKSTNISTFDLGGKLVYNGIDKFSLSAEWVYRSLLNSDAIKPSSRYTINVEYDIGLNQKLTFGIGKNFDGTIKKGDNLIAVLNFIVGFGSSKKIGN